MSKITILAAFMSTFFGRSEKVISEKLSTEEHNQFTEDMSELSEKFEAATTENTRITGELAVAAARITELEGSLTGANDQVTSLTASLQSVTSDRDKYKAHYDEVADKGDKDADQDQNSRGTSGKSSYNENAMSVWQKANK